MYIEFLTNLPARTQRQCGSARFEVRDLRPGEADPLSKLRLGQIVAPPQVLQTDTDMAVSVSKRTAFFHVKKANPGLQKENEKPLACHTGLCMMCAYE